MACGVVPLVTSIGGASDFIQDGINGYLCDPQDKASMVAAAVRILTDDQARQHMIEEGVRDASSDFGAQCVLKEYLEVYDSLLSQG